MECEIAGCYNEASRAYNQSRKAKKTICLSCYYSISLLGKDFKKLLNAARTGSRAQYAIKNMSSK